MIWSGAENAEVEYKPLPSGPDSQKTTRETEVWKKEKKLMIFSHFPEFSTIFLLSRLRTGNNLRLYDFVFTTNYFISIEGDNS